jgi:hypothetical protein
MRGKGEGIKEKGEGNEEKGEGNEGEGKFPGLSPFRKRGLPRMPIGACPDLSGRVRGIFTREIATLSIPFYIRDRLYRYARKDRQYDVSDRERRKGRRD